MRKKLIEVALPLDAINAAASREKSIRHGYPSTLHLWWARRPLAAARAVIFAQMVDDPSEYVDVLLSDAGKKRAAQRELKKRLAARASAAAAPPATGNGNIMAGEKPGATVEAELRAPTLGDVAAELERARLFGILEELVLWENTTNEEVLKRARTEIWQSWRRACADNAGHPRSAELFDRYTLPAFHDPFAGGGSLPLEAQRLGLEAHASDLNPVAVLINKAMIEIPPKFAGRPAVNPESQGEPTVIAKTCGVSQIYGISVLAPAADRLRGAVRQARGGVLGAAELYRVARAPIYAMHLRDSTLAVEMQDFRNNGHGRDIVPSDASARRVRHNLERAPQGPAWPASEGDHSPRRRGAGRPR